MAICEHNIFGDIPAQGNGNTYHSAILTTFGIDLIHFDNRLRNILHRKQIASITVFADQRQLDRQFDCVDPRFLSHAGKDYSISSIAARGAFHPKISFFAGYNAALVIIGSGNLTVGGHGKNHEAFSGFIADTDNPQQKPLIKECWHYLTHFAAQTGDFVQRRILRGIPDNCRLLHDNDSFEPHSFHPAADGLKAALLYNDRDTGILAQLTHSIPMGSVTHITVVSPFFDSDGATLHALLSLCPDAQMEVLIQQSCSMPPRFMPSSKRVSFLDFDQTPRGKAAISGFARRAHAKIFIFRTPRELYCLVGSANATRAAFGTLTQIGDNEEFGILYSSPQRDFYQELGLTPSPGSHVDPGSRETESETADSCGALSLRLLDAAFDGTTVNILTDNPMPAGATAVVDCGSKLLTSTSLSFSVAALPSPAVCYIADANGERISNKVLINILQELELTDPSPKARKLNRILCRIETEGYNSLELTDMLSDVITDSASDIAAGWTKQRQRSSHDKDYMAKELPEIAYDPSADNDEPSSHHLPTAHDDASLLIECIEESIRRKVRHDEEMLTDEEEDARAETAVERPEEKPSATKDDFKRCSQDVRKLLTDYHLLLKKMSGARKRPAKKDFSLFSLVMFATIEVCCLNRFRYVGSCADTIALSTRQKKVFDSLNCLLERDCLTVLSDFACLCQSFSPFDTDSDLRTKGQRAVKYALLFAMFLYRNSPDFNLLQKRIVRGVATLTAIFGMPDREHLTKELEPLIRKSGNIFEMRHLERVARILGLSW